MFKKRLFHGSDHVIETPRYGAGNPRNDYGPGFYCTESIDMAREWAAGALCWSKENKVCGYANEYELALDGLKILDLNSVEYCALHWLAVLLEHRTFEIRAPLAWEAREYLLNTFGVPLEEADVVEGYRADDSYFTFAQDFINGTISYRQLCNAMRLGNLGRQVTLRSPKAFEQLSFTSVHEAARDVWLPRREERDRCARRSYLDVERHKRRPGDLFIMQIIDEEIGPDDARLQ